MSAAIIAYAYVGYPLWLYLRSRFAPHPWNQAPITPTISIIMPVHNGEALLRKKLEHLLALDYPQERTEIIAISDGSNDSTNDILRQVSHPAVRTLILEAPRGKAGALNEAIKYARNEIVLFVDIRPWLEVDAVRRLVSNFADPRVGCAAGELSLREKGHDNTTSAIGGLYWRYEQALRHYGAAVDSTTSVYGGFYAVRRELLTPFPEGLILDDMYQPLRVVYQGYRAVSDPAARVTDSWPEQAAGEFHRKVRTLAGNFQLMQLAPWIFSAKNRLRGQLVSHKLLRLVVPALLPVMLMACWWLGPAPLYQGLFAGQICFYVLALLGICHVPLLRHITGAAAAFAMLNAAVVIGLWKFLFHPGPLWTIWIRTQTPGPAAKVAGPERAGWTGA
jgi:cellulose synthase/poly-beta-1,6-N-acetylglucosamine synthase-like glycosyltransferase